MKAMKLWRNIFVMCAAMLSLASCSNDDEEIRQEYQQAHRSAIFNGVKLVLTDADGNDLGGQTEMFSTLRIYGNLSKQYVSTERRTEDGITYIKFNADLPDERNINYNETKHIGTGTIVSGVNNAWGFLNGLRKGLEFTQEGEPGNVYFAGTFTDNALFKAASERGDGYSF